MTKSKTVIFFGSGPVAAKSLDFISSHFEIEAVITKPVPAHHKTAAPVETLARKLNLPIFFASSKVELDDVVERNSFTSDLGILIDYGVIVSQTVIDAFEFGIVNSHFSLLPQWRGADPITFSILSGQNETGVSLMLIEPTLDTGKLIAVEKIAIDPQDTTPTLTEKLIDLSNKMLVRYVPGHLDGTIMPIEQTNADQATYSRKLSKSDGLIDWDKTAQQIECQIRAYQGWPNSRTQINGVDIIVTKAHISTTGQSPMDIRCHDGLYICIDQLIAPSGKTMDAKSFINGYRITSSK
ncbi:MAG: methionyl-tRNA formyltransferase [Candidatus Saccharibacteria bacterium]